MAGYEWMTWEPSLVSASRKSQLAEGSWEEIVVDMVTIHSGPRQRFFHDNKLRDAPWDIFFKGDSA